MKKSRLFCAALALSILSGCAGTTTKTPTVQDSSNFVPTTSDTYPIETDYTLDYWVALPGPIASYTGSMNDIPLHDMLEEATGVSINFVHPAVGQQNEAFNLMIASMDLPDLIESGWLTYPGGARNAIDEGIILKLNDYIDKVSPNFKKVMEERPEVKAQCTTDDSSYFAYPFILGDDRLATYMGFILRKDLLDKAGLDTPKTIEDWDKVLRSFKEQGVKIPLSMRLGEAHYRMVSPFAGCFGIMNDFFHDGETVKYGPYMPEFKEYLTQLNTWYKDGILDNNFSNIESAAYNSGMINGDIGATFCTCGGEFGKWLPAIKDSEVDLVPVPYPAATADARPMAGQKNQPLLNVCTAISTQCENPEVAVRFLDFGYSEAGHMLYNFGKEGTSYNMVNNEPIYTPEIVDLEKNGGIAINQAMSRYLRAYSDGPFVQDVRYSNQYMTNPIQREALTLWSDTDATVYSMPYLSMTEEESEKYGKIMQDIATYEMEMVHKFIAGVEPLENFDTYIETLKKMGIEDAIKIKQQAYDRFTNKN